MPANRWSSSVTRSKMFLITSGIVGPSVLVREAQGGTSPAADGQLTRSDGGLRLLYRMRWPERMRGHAAQPRRLTGQFVLGRGAGQRGRIPPLASQTSPFVS